MTTELSALRKAYEDEGMSPEEISKDRELDVMAVKSGLMQCSSKYRKDCGKEDENIDVLKYTIEEQQRAKKMILNLALGAEDEHLRAKMSCRVVDEGKGRLDVMKDMRSGGMNLFFINEQMRKVREVGSVIKQGLLGNSNKEREPINV